MASQLHRAVYGMEPHGAGLVNTQSSRDRNTSQNQAPHNTKGTSEETPVAHPALSTDTPQMQLHTAVTSVYQIHATTGLYLLPLALATILLPEPSASPPTAG
jgi:hypothetical protein